MYFCGRPACSMYTLVWHRPPSFGCCWQSAKGKDWPAMETRWKHNGNTMYAFVFVHLCFALLFFDFKGFSPKWRRFRHVQTYIGVQQCVESGKGGQEVPTKKKMIACRNTTSVHRESRSLETETYMCHISWAVAFALPVLDPLFHYTNLMRETLADMSVKCLRTHNFLLPKIEPQINLLEPTHTT